MKKYLLLAATFLFVSCNAPQQSSKSDLSQTVASLSYFRDDSTDLCFAQVISQTGHAYNNISITDVPCTPKVLAKI